jgi:ABC-type bacteriocin/lantibiotic exporter with double-glycine peptidase domain
MSEVMNEDLLENEEKINFENNQANTQFNYMTLIKIFLIIDIISFILTLIFAILFIKVLFIIFLCLTIIFAFALIISLYLYYKRKEKEKEKVELKRPEGEKRAMNEVIEVQEKKEREIKKKK